MGLQCAYGTHEDRCPNRFVAEGVPLSALLEADGWEPLAGSGLHAHTAFCPQHAHAGHRVRIEPEFPKTKLSGLQEAEGLINGPRAADYGSFQHEADKIAKVFHRVKPVEKVYVTIEQEEKQHARLHALYMMCVKLVRESHSHKRDNIVDLMGYAELYLQNCEEDHAKENPIKGHQDLQEEARYHPDYHEGCPKLGPHWCRV